VPVLDYDAASDWIRVDYNGQQGWSAAWLATINGQLGGFSAPEAGPGCTCFADLYDCADFSTQADAQACYEFCLMAVGGDVHRLDDDEDGVVCGGLP
jgi:hypothetical protein